MPEIIVLMLRIILIVLTLGIFSSPLMAQTGTFMGVVKSSSDGNGVPFAKVVLPDANKFELTDIDGLFSIPEIPVGTYTVRITASNFETKILDIEVEANKILKMEIEITAGKTLGVVDVDYNDGQKKIDPGTSIQKMDNEDIKRIPSPGLPEFAIAIQTIPGIVSTGDQGGQFYVRGGTPIQNKITLDGMTIYNPFHSIGFFSVFETDLIKSADIYTGGFNAKYGGRISSIMDLSYRDGNTKRLGGMIGISPFTSSLLLEGPLSKDNGISFVISGKASLLEETSKVLYPYINEGDGLPFNFWDLYGKISVKGDGANKFSVFGFSFNDQVTYQAVSNLKWNSWGGGTNFIFVPNNSELFMRGRLNVSSYDILLEEEGINDRSSGIVGGEMAFDFTYHLPGKHKLDYGFGFNYFQTKFLTYNEVNRRIEHDNNTIEAGAYVSYRAITKNRRLILEPSIRFQGYSSVGQVTAEPRFSGKYNVTDVFRLKVAGGYYTQNFTSTTSDKDVVNLFYGFITAPGSADIPADFVNPDGTEKDIKNGLQKAWHAIGGLEVDLTQKLSLNIEGYYKWFSQMTNINTNKIYDDNVENSQVDDILKKDFISESGQAFGGDIVFKYLTTSKVSGNSLYLWLAYSIGKVTRWNGFEYYAPVFDRRHNINFIGSYSFGKNQSWDFTARWNLGTGLPFKQTNGVYEEPIINSIDFDYVNGNASELTFLYDDQNNGRLSTYHRLDISLKKTIKPAKFKNMEWQIIAGVTNTYSRDNIFYVNRVTNERVHQLPIMPSLAVSLRF